MSDTKLWRGAVVPATIVAIIALVINLVLKGKSGFIGGLLASITVIIFFSVHLLVSRISRELDPTATMILAMLSYFFKITFMALFLVLIEKFTDRSSCKWSVELHWSWICSRRRNDYCVIHRTCFT